jgi:exodeoxyribonuclease-1
MKTFFFYDLETSGLSPREDRVMQFAGQRTDMDLKPIGEPVDFLVKLNDDTLPSPHAILVTKITPQQTLANGLSEAEFAKYLNTEIFTPDTIAVGYNSIRFDDEFIRHLFWRNFYDPYEWQWKDGRSRWDLLDVVRLTRAIRGDDIKWPVDKEGKPTNRLELITKLNGISHESAHDALSDVNALIEVTKLIKQKQPQLYEYLLKMRDKKEVAKLVNLEDKKPFVYSSGRYPSEFNKTTVAFPLTSGRNGNIVVYDLRYDPDEFLKTFEEFEKSSFSRPSQTVTTVATGNKASPRNDGSDPNSVREKDDSQILPRTIIKELQYNRCPAVAPLGVLENDNGWEKIELSKETIEKNLTKLLARPDLAEKAREHFENRPEFPKALDPESALYDSFLPDGDKRKVEAVRNADAKSLADFNLGFLDERLPDLLVHYKARNFPKSLNADESAKWETYRTTRLHTKAEPFMNALNVLASQNADSYILEELKLWFESIFPSEY